LRCAALAGVGHCYGDVSVRAPHRNAANGFDIRPGAHARVSVLIGGLRPGSRVTLVLRGLGGTRQRVRTLVRGSGAADRRRSCRPPGAFVLAQNDVATVITDDLGSAAAVCLKATGRTIDVPFDYPDGPFALRGHWFVGMGRNCGDGLEGCDIDVVVLNLRTGQTRYAGRNQPPFDCSNAGGGNCGDSAVARIVVRRHGQAAWVTCATTYERGPCPRGRRSVLSLDSRGIREIVQRGRIRARSLRASPTGRSFTWIQDGRRHASQWHRAPPMRRR
jgi:hypothetical protein